MKIAILNHIDGTVDILDANIHPDADFDWDLWLSELGYHVSCCSWMSDVKEIAFKDVRNL